MNICESNSRTGISAEGMILDFSYQFWIPLLLTLESITQVFPKHLRKFGMMVSLLSQSHPVLRVNYFGHSKTATKIVKKELL